MGACHQWVFEIGCNEINLDASVTQWLTRAVKSEVKLSWIGGLGV